jgi:F-type H+-transporting ATPase subunit b
MGALSRTLGPALFAALCCLAAPAAANEPATEGHAAAAEAHGAEAGHEGGHAAEHVPTFDDLNLARGFLGEQGGGICGLLGAKPGDPPTVLCRKPGDGIPYLALWFNAGLLFWLLWHYGKGPLREALDKRKESIQRGMSEAARLRGEAEARLTEYRAKLDHLEEEIDRVKHDMRAAAEAERGRILDEAREKRERLERDARQILDQELKAARAELRAEVIRQATETARTVIAQQISASDQQRLGDEYLASLRTVTQSRRARA